jgi:RNA polymerase sigma-70 factor (sigma-E family)
MIERAALRAVAQGDSASDAFRDFFEAEYARLGRALYLLTGDHAEAEELAQDALVRVYERWGRVRSMDSPVGYLYRTAMNLNRNRLRRLSSAARRVLFHREPDPPTSQVEERDALFRAITTLPVGQRQALVLVEWLGLSAEETAGVLELRPVSVRVRLSRAHASLRDLLEDDDG